MARPTSSFAAVQTADRRLELQEFALLRVEATGVCGTDVEQFNGHMHASGWACYPQIPGHEGFGRIAWVGEEAACIWNVKAGDRVSVEGTVPCWVCPQCRTGRHRFCR